MKYEPTIYVHIFYTTSSLGTDAEEDHGDAEPTTSNIEQVY